MSSVDAVWGRIEKAASSLVEKSDGQLSQAQAVAKFLQSERGKELYARHQGAAVTELARGYLRAGIYTMPEATRVVKAANKAAKTKVEKSGKKPPADDPFWDECRKLHELGEAEKRGERRGWQKAARAAGVNLDYCSERP